MTTQPQVKRYGHVEGAFEGTRAGFDDAYGFVRRAAGNAPEAEMLGDVLQILAGNAIRWSDSGGGGRFSVQLAALRGRWMLRVDDEGHRVNAVRLMASEKGEPLHGLAALNAARVVWTLHGQTAICAEIECPLPDDVLPDLSVPAKRAAASIL